MHFAWSMVEYPTLYMARTTDPKQCSCNASTYDPSYQNETTPNGRNGTVKMPGLGSDFSLTVVFTRLVEFNGTDKYLAVDGFNSSIVCNKTAFESNKNFTNVSLSDMDWTFHLNNFTFIGSINRNDTVYKNTTRFSITVSEVL